MTLSKWTTLVLLALLTVIGTGCSEVRPAVADGKEEPQKPAPAQATEPAGP